MDGKARQFEILVQALGGELYRYAYGLCHERGLAEDLVQETFLRAWRARDSLRDRQAVRSWLYTILRREFLRGLERQRPEFRDPDSLVAVAPVDYDTRTEAFSLRWALARLPLEYREPLLLQVIGGFSCAEIAELLGLSVDATMMRVSRARRRLRGMLREDAAPQQRSGRT